MPGTTIRLSAVAATSSNRLCCAVGGDWRSSAAFFAPALPLRRFEGLDDDDAVAADRVRDLDLARRAAAAIFVGWRLTGGV